MLAIDWSFLMIIMILEYGVTSTILRLIENHDTHFFQWILLCQYALLLYHMYHIFCDRSQGVQIDGIMSDVVVCCVGCHRAQFWDQGNCVCIFFHLVRSLYTIILAITFMRMTPKSTFHLNVRIRWNHWHS